MLNFQLIYVPHALPFKDICHKTRLYTPVKFLSLFCLGPVFFQYKNNFIQLIRFDHIQLDR